MAGLAPFYQVERRGHRTGYLSKDVDGEKLKDEDMDKDDPSYYWHGLPDELLSDLNIEEVVERWRAHSSVSAFRRGVGCTRLVQTIADHFFPFYL